MNDDDDDRDLFGEPYYPSRPGYVRDSDTSSDAADSLDEEMLSALRAKIFALLDVRGERGATCDEVEVALDLRHQTASARLRELVLADLIFDTGKRRQTRSGRGARVYCTRRIQRQAMEAGDARSQPDPGGNGGGTAASAADARRDPPAQ